MLSSILFLCFNLAIVKFKNSKNTRSSTKFPVNLKFLLLFAICFQSQIYPLFDQMHFWWGSPLTFLVAVIVYKENFGIIFSTLANKSSFTVVGIFLLLTSVLVPWTAQLSSHKRNLPIEIGENIYTTPQNAQYQIELQEFFHKNIYKGAKVLNLCDETNIFFEDNQYVPASRFFVFWGEQMSHAPSISRSFIDSKPDFVLTCGLTHAPSLRLRQEKMQQKILETIIMKPTDPSLYVGQPNKIWRIYKA